MKKDTDVVDIKGKNWLYSKKVKDHFFFPKNILKDNQNLDKFNAFAEIGSPACGDVMRVYLKINPKTMIIEDFKWRTFGCASAIASTSILSEMVIGKKVDDASKITAKDIVKELGGLPKKKIHCSVLGDQALRLAIDYFKNSLKK